MNQAARDALREAALNGVSQLHGSGRDEHGGKCALAVIEDAGLDWTHMKMSGEQQCSICGRFEMDEAMLAIHLNDDHQLDFLAIAEKMPVTEEPA